MGEVYRALDTRLQRIVAVKILPSHLSEDPDAKERFDREARTISSLTYRKIKISCLKFGTTLCGYEAREPDSTIQMRELSRRSGALVGSF
jgi:serine/threonine protein kinase